MCNYAFIFVFIGTGSLFANQVRVPKRFTEHNLILAASGEAPQVEPEGDLKRSISLSRYLLGGGVGTLLGMGFGHLVQGRYFASRAWIYSLLQGFSLSLYVVAKFKLIDLKKFKICVHKEEQNALLTLALFTKVPEVINVWLPDSDIYEVAANQRVWLSPLFAANQWGVALTVSL